MPSLVRYVGPLAAYRGAIGVAADGGAIIGGRVRLGDVESPVYPVSVNGVWGGTYDSWGAAIDAMADYARSSIGRYHPDVTAIRALTTPDPAGLVVTVGEHVYKLEVV